MIPALLLLSLLVAPLSQAAPPAGDRVVARADGLDVRSGDFGAWLVERVGLDYARDYLIERLAVREAERRGLLPAPEEVAAAVEDEYQTILRNVHGGDEAKYLNVLNQRGYEKDEWKAARRKQLLPPLAMDAIIRDERVIDEEALEARFRATYGAQAERTTVEALFFSAYRGLNPLAGERPDIAALRVEARERAAAARAAIEEGRPLAELLPGSDSGSRAIVDGRVDRYKPGQLGPEVEKAMRQLDDPGEITPVVDVVEGSWVVRLVERRPIALEEAREELTAELRDAPVHTGEYVALHERLLAENQAEILLP